jgi:hypothetical protein
VHTHRYAAKEGFQIEIDRLFQMPGATWTGKKPQLFSVMYCLAGADFSEASAFYDDDSKVKLTDRLGVVKRHVWKSPWKHQAFDDGPLSMRVKYGEVEHDPNLVLVLQVRSVVQDKKGKFISTSIGWTALQIFFPLMGVAPEVVEEEEEAEESRKKKTKKKKKKKKRRRGGAQSDLPGFVQNGTHQLPLFDGQPSLETLDKMETATFGAVVGKEQQKRGSACSLVLSKTKSSIVVKLWDCQLDPVGEDEREKSSLSNFDEILFASHLLKDGMGKRPWEFSMEKLEKESGAPLSKILPKGIDSDAYEKKSRASMKKWVEK